MPNRFQSVTLLVGLSFLASCSGDTDVFVVNQERFCVPKGNVLRANVMWLPSSVPSSGGFNFQSKAYEGTSIDLTGAVMPKGHYGAFPKPARDSVYVAELRAAKEADYATVGQYVVLGDPSKSSSVRIWERESFAASKNSRFENAPELIASCQRFETGSNRAPSLLCERAIKQATYDVVFSFAYVDLKALPSIEKQVKDQVAGWQCSKG